MAPDPRILKAKDFGAFEPELKQRFRDAFGFAWDAGSESLEDAANRKRFAVAISAASAQIDIVPPRCREFLEKIYGLQLELNRYLWPGEALRDELIAIFAAVSAVGDKISRLSAVDFTRRRKDLPSASQVGKLWRQLEVELRTARDGVPPTDAGEDVRRLRRIGERSFFLICAVMAALSGLSPSCKNGVKRAEIVNAVEEIDATLDTILKRLKEYLEACVPPPPDEAPYRAYFQRIAEDLAIGGLRSKECEVPHAALFRPRDLPARRAHVLEWLCMRDPKLYPLLPTAARRDHRVPTAAGGRGQRNQLLHGVAAALILLELVEHNGVRSRTGKQMFEATVKRVERWISERAEAGHFFVDLAYDGHTQLAHLSAPILERYLISTQS